MCFRIIYHHFRSWEQFRFYAVGVFAAVDYAWLWANYREWKRELAGRLELRQHLRREAFTTIRKSAETSLRAQEELEKQQGANEVE